VKVSQVVLQTCWKLGRLQVEEEFPFFASVLCAATDSSFDIFSPLGTDLVKAPRDVHDYDDTIDGTNALSCEGPAPEPNLEDAVAEEDASENHRPYFELNGRQIYKSRYLNQVFTNYKKTGSTDRLKRVANIERYAKPTIAHDSVLDHDPMSGENQVQMDSPIATLVQCDGRIFLCVGEVNDITVDSQHADHIGVDYLTEPTVFVSYQMLDIVQASIDDDPSLRHDWRWSGKRGSSHRVSGCLVQPINPSVSTQQLANPFYLFESSVLMAIGATIFERLGSGLGIILPEVRQSDRFPYREATGDIP
jgi:hypothetical protein